MFVARVSNSFWAFSRTSRVPVRLNCSSSSLVRSNIAFCFCCAMDASAPYSCISPREVFQLSSTSPFLQCLRDRNSRTFSGICSR